MISLVRLYSGYGAVRFRSPILSMSPFCTYEVHIVVEAFKILIELTPIPIAIAIIIH